MTTFPIGLTTLTVGSHVEPPSGGLAISDGLSAVFLNVDRTVAGGLDSLTTASVMVTSLDLSFDGAVTWQNLGSGPVGGGTVSDRHGVIHTSTIGFSIPPGTGRQLRATFVVSGPSSIAVAGTVVAN